MRWENIKELINFAAQFDDTNSISPASFQQKEGVPEVIDLVNDPIEDATFTDR